MIYVTGDTHGSIDIRKLLENEVTDQMTEKDTLIICGDFGLVWNWKREAHDEKKWLKWLDRRPWTTVFADGNHECFPRLNSYPIREWNGGKVHEIRPKILHLMRGEIYEIEGQSIWVMGGAASHDRGPAKGDTDVVIGKAWWPEEIPSDEELANGTANLEKHGNRVDYIITHCLPTLYQDIVKRGEFKADKLTEYFEQIRKTVQFRRWYSGHYHVNIDVDEHVTVVFSRIIRIGETIAESATILGSPKYRRQDAVLIEYEGEQLLGTVKDVMPWGTILKHDEPYYDIELYDTDRKKPVVTVKETQVIEKSLIK